MWWSIMFLCSIGRELLCVSPQSNGIQHEERNNKLRCIIWAFGPDWNWQQIKGYIVPYKTKCILRILFSENDQIHRRTKICNKRLNGSEKPNWIGKTILLKATKQNWYRNKTLRYFTRQNGVYFQMYQLFLCKDKIFLWIFFLLQIILLSPHPSIHPSIAWLLVTKLMRTFVITYRLTMDLFRFLSIFLGFNHT